MYTVRPEDYYGTSGSVQQVTPDGDLGQGITAQANPDDFGAQVGQAIQQAGRQGNQIASQYQGLANEASQTDADMKYSNILGQIQAKAASMTGEELLKNKQSLIDDALSAHQDISNSLNPMSARGFNMMASYRTSRFLQGLNYMGANLIKQRAEMTGAVAKAQTIISSLDPSVANDENAMQEKIGDIKQFASLSLDQDHPGFVKDESGMKTGFTNDEYGNELKSTFQNIVEQDVGNLRINQFKTLGDQNPADALNHFNQIKDNIPQWAHPEILSTLIPQLRDFNINQNAHVARIKAQQDYYQNLLNPQQQNGGIPAWMRNEGTGKNPNSTASGAGQFLDSTWISTVRELHPEWAGKSDQEILAMKGTDPQLNHDATIFKLKQNAEYLTKSLGRAPTPQEEALAWQQGAHGATALLKNPNMTAVQALENAGVKNASDSILNNGGNPNQTAASFVQQQTAFYAKNGGFSNVPYATNQNGTKQSLADYLNQNKNKILMNVEENGLKAGDDPSQIRDTQELVGTWIDGQIRQQKESTNQDRDFLMRGIGGELTSGKVPTLAQLKQIQGMGDVLKRVMVHSPELYASIPKLLEKFSEVSGAGIASTTDRTYGSQYTNLWNKAVIGGSIGMNDLAMAVSNGDLTPAGYRSIIKDIPNGPESAAAMQEKKIAQEQLMYKMFQTNKLDPSHNNFDKWQRALPLINQWYADGLKKGWSYGEMTNPDNKEKYVGNAVASLMPSPTQAKINKISPHTDTDDLMLSFVNAPPAKQWGMIPSMVKEMKTDQSGQTKDRISKYLASKLVNATSVQERAFYGQMGEQLGLFRSN